MKSVWVTGNMTLATSGKRWLLGAMVAAGLALASSSVISETVKLSEETQACVDCHDKETKQKKLDNGENAFLAYFDRKPLPRPMHKEDRLRGLPLGY